MKNKGISLIVLVITIIIMIILGGAVIISINNNGIIDRANSAIKSHNENEVYNIAQLAWSEAFLDGANTVEQYTQKINQALENNGIDTSKYLIEVTLKGVTVHDKDKWWVQDGLNITKGDVTLEAGDLIQYNAGVSGYTGAWKVLGAEDGKLLIISANSVGNQGFYSLEGGTYNGNYYSYGLLNAIARLNQLCSEYGEGTGAVGSRSVKVEDIDNLTGYDKTNYGVNTISQYENKVKYSWNATDEAMIDFTATNGVSGKLNHPHRSGFNYVDFNTMTKITVPVNSSGMPTLTSDYYSYNISSSNMAAESIKAKNMILGENNNINYWLASNYTLLTQINNAMFGLRLVYNGSVSAGYFYYSTDYEIYAGTFAVRCVVELSPDIKILQKDNTLGWSYTI